MDGPVMLASAVSYALKAAALVGPADLPRPTPCPDWDLGLLLRHLSGSMADLEEAIATGRLDADPYAVPHVTPFVLPGGGGNPGNPVELVRDRAAGLLYAMFTTAEPVIEVSGLPVPRELLMGAGAMEIAVHGWDTYVACGRGRVVPPALARPLIRLFPRLITVRQGLFGNPVAAPPCASPGDQLVAYLGRDPGARHQRPPPRAPGGLPALTLPPAALR
ncbi:MAG: maleylpyruvate isomerase family mycothiol-dependent enzyme [Streptosporangiaceae bacterium]|nr:maleylpyruvate isomerase family mycothiol-dependent enzyme [Streptosporangiaceae bacterium]